MNNISINQPSRFSKFIGKRFGKLQLIRYLGKDQTTNAAVFEAQCSCGRTEQASLSDLQSGHKYACSVCVPPAKAQTARDWFADERRMQIEKAAQLKQEAASQVADRQRQEAAQREADIRQRQKELIDGAFGTPEPPKASEEKWSAPRTFRRF